MRISNEPVKAFLELQKKLLTVLNLFGITQSHIYAGIGMSRKTFERKLKNHGFTIGEMFAICDLLNYGEVKTQNQNISN